MLHTSPGFATCILSAALLWLLAPLAQAQALSVDDVTLTEGDVPATFTVTLSAPAGRGGVTFDIATANNTALSGSDYIANSQLAQTIAAGGSTATFAVVVNDDNVFEGLQDYFVNVSNVTGATIADAQGTGTIADNEALPVAAFTSTSSSANEGATGTNTPMIVTVDLSGLSEVELSFNYTTAGVTATTGVDYVSASGILVFAPAETQSNLTVSFIGDDTIENDEQFTLDLLIPRGGDTHTLSILNDDTAGIGAASIPTLEITGLLLLLSVLCALGVVASRSKTAKDIRQSSRDGMQKGAL